MVCTPWTSPVPYLCEKFILFENYILYIGSDAHSLTCLRKYMYVHIV